MMTAITVTDALEAVSMAMAAEKVVELCSKNADALREDLALMERGTIKIHVFGADVTHEQAARLRANLSRLQEIIDACGGECGLARH